MYSKMSNAMVKEDPTFTDLYYEVKKVNPQIAKIQQANGQGTSQQSFNRQDSLALASSFQERDRQRNMGDFMETELDLDNYLACFTELDVPIDQVDFNDTELQKAHILYTDDVFAHHLDPYNGPYAVSNQNQNPYDELAEMYNKPEEVYRPPPPPPPVVNPPAEPQEEIKYEDDAYEMQCDAKRDSGSDDASIATSKNRRNVKKPAHLDLYTPEEEEEDEDDYSSNMETTPSISEDEEDNGKRKTRKRKANNSLNGFKPQTKARKYNLRPDVEKAQPVYKLKRARNNDAVRKSRNKAKELQKKRDDEYEKMKRKIFELEGLLDAEQKARKRDREIIEHLLNVSKRGK